MERGIVAFIGPGGRSTWCLAFGVVASPALIHFLLHPNEAIKKDHLFPELKVSGLFGRDAKLLSAQEVPLAPVFGYILLVPAP
jgi:hypothetical protein